MCFKLLKKRNINDISFKELNEIVNSNTNTVLLDIRNHQEFNEGHLNNAINIPLYELEECNDSLLKNKDNIIIVYCQSGIRSKRAIKLLYKKGFNNLYNLKDGLDGI